LRVGDVNKDNSFPNDFKNIFKHKVVANKGEKLASCPIGFERQGGFQQAKVYFIAQGVQDVQSDVLAVLDVLAHKAVIVLATGLAGQYIFCFQKEVAHQFTVVAPVKMGNIKEQIPKHRTPYLCIHFYYSRS
jgi:hypothetical protein